MSIGRNARDGHSPRYCMDALAETIPPSYAEPASKALSMAIKGSHTNYREKSAGRQAKDTVCRCLCLHIAPGNPVPAVYKSRIVRHIKHFAFFSQLIPQGVQPSPCSISTHLSRSAAGVSRRKCITYSRRIEFAHTHNLGSRPIEMNPLHGQGMT